MTDTTSPLFVDVLLYTMYALLLLAAGLTLWSMLRSMRRQGRAGSRSNGIPARRIGVLTVVLLVGSLLFTYVLASTRPLIINGQPFDDRFWLRVSDMLMGTSAILILTAAIGVAASLLGLGRKLKH